MRRIAIDTNVYVSFKANDREVLHVLRNCDYIGIDITVIAELLSGFKIGSQEARNKAELELFLDSPRAAVLAHDLETAEYYAVIVQRLRKKGRPIPVNDIWIAANAMRHGLTLFSLDSHFREIDGLVLS